MNQKLRVWGLPVLVLGLLVAADLITKSMISNRFRLGESLPLIDGFLNFTLVHNTGAAFGMGNTWSHWFFISLTFVAIGVMTVLYARLGSEEKLSRWGLVLILSGAIGNLVDRIRLGYVVDFVDVYVKTHHWPAFNFADAAITVGAVLFGIELLFSNRLKKTPN